MLFLAAGGAATEINKHNPPPAVCDGAGVSLCHYLSQLLGITTEDFPRLPYKDITRIVDSLITLSSLYSALSTLIKIILQTTTNPLPDYIWAQRRGRKIVLTYRRNIDGRVAHAGGEIVHVGVVAAVVVRVVVSLVPW